jgi:hypothetical protein
LLKHHDKILQTSLLFHTLKDGKPVLLLVSYYSNTVWRVQQKIHRLERDSKSHLRVARPPLYVSIQRSSQRGIGRPQPRSEGFRVRTRGETRKPWSGPVNFAFWLAYTILSKNSRTWQLTITIQHKFMIVVYEYILQNNLSK